MYVGRNTINGFVEFIIKPLTSKFFFFSLFFIFFLLSVINFSLKKISFLSSSEHCSLTRVRNTPPGALLRECNHMVADKCLRTTNP